MFTCSVGGASVRCWQGNCYKTVGQLYTSLMAFARYPFEAIDSLQPCTLAQFLHRLLVGHVFCSANGE